MTNSKTQTKKKTWIQPEVSRLRAGSAETQAGRNPDGGGGAQGS